MTDRYDEMKIPPDRSQAETLRQRLHARMESVSRDHQGRSDLHLDADRPGPDAQFFPMEIDVTLDSPVRETGGRRRMLIAAAAVVAVIGAAATAFAVRRADETPSPAAATTIATTTSVAPTMKTVRFAVESADGIPVTFAVPVDWTLIDGWAAYKDLGTGVLFDAIGNIYADGCDWVLVDPPVGPSVDDLVAAWADVPRFAVSAAVDVNVDGYTGKQIEVTVPDYKPGECRGVDGGQFGLWQTPADATNFAPGFWAQGPDQHLQQWILDVDGTRLVIAASYLPSTPAQDRAVLDQILSSIRIG